MRKRSGGLHSQSEEEYIKLAQLTQNKLGIFYDQKLLTSNVKTLKKKASIDNGTKDDIFADFDFNQQKIEHDQQQQETNAKSQQLTLRKVVIIAANTTEIKTAINILIKQHIEYQCYYNHQNQSGPNCDLDLIVLRTKKSCVKYWIMSFRFFQCPISPSNFPFDSGYIKGASNIFAFVGSPQLSNKQMVNTLKDVKNIQIIRLEQKSIPKQLEKILQKMKG